MILSWISRGVEGNNRLVRVGMAPVPCPPPFPEATAAAASTSSNNRDTCSWLPCRGPGPPPPLPNSRRLSPLLSARPRPLSPLARRFALTVALATALTALLLPPNPIPSPSASPSPVPRGVGVEARVAPDILRDILEAGQGERVCVCEKERVCERD